MWTMTLLCHSSGPLARGHPLHGRGIPRPHISSLRCAKKRALVLLMRTSLGLSASIRPPTMWQLVRKLCAGPRLHWTQGRNPRLIRSWGPRVQHVSTCPVAADVSPGSRPFGLARGACIPGSCEGSCGDSACGDLGHNSNGDRGAAQYYIRSGDPERRPRVRSKFDAADRSVSCSH